MFVYFLLSYVWIVNLPKSYINEKKEFLQQPDLYIVIIGIFKEMLTTFWSRRHTHTREDARKILVSANYNLLLRHVTADEWYNNCTSVLAIIIGVNYLCVALSFSHYLLAIACWTLPQHGFSSLNPSCARAAISDASRWRWYARSADTRGRLKELGKYFL